MEKMSIAIDTELLRQMEEVCAQNGITVEEAFNQFAEAVARDKSILIQMMEDAEDLRLYEEAIAEYRKNPVSSPAEELWKELGLDGNKPQLIFEKWRFVEVDGYPSDAEWCVALWKADNGEIEIFVGGYSEEKKTFYANFGLGGAVLDQEHICAWTPLYGEYRLELGEKIPDDEIDDG